MYPFLRMAFKLFRSRRQPAIGPLDTHISHHICWPWDIDPWCELNNGRTLTLYDLGRLPMARRSGLIRLLINNKWSITIAGASVRYRRRIRMFERIEMRSRVVGWDERFIYMEQSMWKRSGDCANHILLRNAVTSAEGIVPPDKVAQAFEFKGPPPGSARLDHRMDHSRGPATLAPNAGLTCQLLSRQSYPKETGGQNGRDIIAQAHLGLDVL